MRGWIVILLLICGLSKPAMAEGPASDTVIRETLFKLSSSVADERRQAMFALAKTGDERVEDILNQFRLESLYLWSNTVVRCDKFKTMDGLKVAPLLDAISGRPLVDAAGAALVVPAADLISISASRADRKTALSAISLTALSAPDPQKRLSAVRKCGSPPRQEESIELLSAIAAGDPVKAIRSAAVESRAMILLSLPAATPEQRIQSAQALGKLKSSHGLVLLNELLKDGKPTDAEKAAYLGAIEKIQFYQNLVRVFDSLKFGLSTGSVLILMALGLSITFGLMGVINMAHGELMMIGAYATYCMQLLFGHTPDAPSNWYFVAALPVAFSAAALVGLLMEVLVVRHLYRRPLESLLATYGCSLILIQVIRILFGDNRACNSPTWLVGSFEVLRDMTLSYNRVFVFVLALLCLPLLHLLMTRTSLGLHMRATMQNRNMAGALGVNTRLVDRCTFMLGSGMAGVAGYALTTIGGITPDMGQNYIVDSFLVVVTGGVGELAGVVCSGFGVGLLTKLLEGTFFGTVWAKIIVLSAVIVFIQYKPSGLFALKGRLADD